MVAVLISVAANAFAQQDSLVILGSISSDGTIVKQVNTVGGSVSVTNPSPGEYRAQLDAPGAFAGVLGTEFSVNVSLISGGASDRVAGATITSFTDDRLNFSVSISDAEDSADPDRAKPQNAPFHFLVRRLPSNGVDLPAASRYLHAAGQLLPTGDLANGVAINGGTITTSQSGVNGDYDIVVEKTGAYTDDADSDYMVFLTPRTSSTQDHTIGAIVTTMSDDQVLVSVRSVDAQSATASSNPSASSTSFYFSIYRIPSTASTDLPNSRLLAASARVTSFGTLDKGATSIPGATITASRSTDGFYRISIISPGAFAGRSVTEFVPILTLNISAAGDRTIRGDVVKPNDNEIRVHVSTIDIEEDGEAAGVRTDANLYLTLLDIGTSHQPDMKIGTKKRLASLRGNDVYNSNGARQKAKLKIYGRKKAKLFFAAENDGNVVDDIRMRAISSKRVLSAKHYRLTGGRRNVTALLKRNQVAAPGLKPGETSLFESRVKFKKPNGPRRQKLLVRGTSNTAPTATDTARADVIRKK